MALKNWSKFNLSSFKNAQNEKFAQFTTAKFQNVPKIFKIEVVYIQVPVSILFLLCTGNEMVKVTNYQITLRFFCQLSAFRSASALFSKSENKGSDQLSLFSVIITLFLDPNTFHKSVIVRQKILLLLFRRKSAMSLIYVSTKLL